MTGYEGQSKSSASDAISNSKIIPLRARERERERQRDRDRDRDRNRQRQRETEPERQRLENFIFSRIVWIGLHGLFQSKPSN